MGAVEVNDLTYTLPGGRVLLEGVSFRVGEGQHVALVGANGTGKTTLLRILVGLERVQSGHLRVDGRVGLMQQFIGQMGSEVTVRDLLLSLAPQRIRDAAHELAWAEMGLAAGGRRAEMAYARALAHWGDAGGYDAEVLWDTCTTDALGRRFDEAFDRPVTTLSGGEQKRVALEALFRSEFDVLLLDEPDNFLDIAGKRRLEARLNDSPKTILFVSHDRALLANTCTRVVTLEGRDTWMHVGPFSGYLDARAHRMDRIEEETRRYLQERARLVASIKEFKRRAAMNDKFASRAKAMETQLRRFEADNKPRERPEEQDVRMQLAGARTGKIAFRATRLALTGLVESFSAEIHYGERVAVVGPNGTGKSHFLRLLAGEEVRHEGEMLLGARVAPGLFHQTHERPDLAGRRLLDLLTRSGLEMGRAMSGLRRYGLRDAATLPFELLSEGQQARFQILLMEIDNPTMLLLDEPTDNLDIDSAEALETGLARYRGTVIAVSHDRWFLRTFERFLVFDDDGSVSDRLEWEPAAEFARLPG